MNNANLYKAWQGLCKPYCTLAQAESAWSAILKRYSEPHRQYHTLSHVAEMLALAQVCQNGEVDYDALRFAIWFHDFIYFPASSDNEEKSAQWAGDWLSDTVFPYSRIQSVVQMIRATAEHELGELGGSAQFLLDLDLFTLGADPATYKRYVAQVRAEYYMFSDVEFYQGRRLILERFLARDAIFVTSFIAERYEKQARLNLMQELSSF